MQISDQGGQKQSFGFFPERIAATAFALGVGHQRCHQLQNVFFAVDISEGVVVHTLGKVNGVQDFQLVTVLQKCVPALDHDTTFRIGDDIGAVALKQIRLQPKACFT